MTSSAGQSAIYPRSLVQVLTVRHAFRAPDFPWCGRLIDTRHLHVKGDYSRDSTRESCDPWLLSNMTVETTLTGLLFPPHLERSDIKNTLSVNTLRHPGLTIRAKVFRYVANAAVSPW